MCKISEELRNEGFAEGLAQGRNEAVQILKKLGTMSDEAIAKETRLSLEQVKAITAQ